MLCVEKHSDTPMMQRKRFRSPQSYGITSSLNKMIELHFTPNVRIPMGQLSLSPTTRQTMRAGLSKTLPFKKVTEQLI